MTLLLAAHKAVRDHMAANRGKPVELRMTKGTAKALAAEAGFVIEDRDLEGARIFDILISIDTTLDFGEIVTWPTPDEMMWTEIVARRSQRNRPTTRPRQK